MNGNTQDNLPQRRREFLLAAGGGGLVAALASDPARAQDDDATGQINELSGFETPLPITNDSNRFQTVSPANRLRIDAETDDTVDLVIEWGELVTVEQGGFAISGSGILTDERDIGDRRAIFRGDGRPAEFGDNLYDRLTLRGLNTDAVTPGDEVPVMVSARQADSPADTEDFDDVVDAVDGGTFDAEATTEATFEVTQGTLISANDTATSSLDLAADAQHTIAFDIDQLRDEAAGGTPAGPAQAIIVDYFIDDDDGLTFDLDDDDVTLGGAAADLDLEVVKEREIPGVGQVLLEIADGETLEDGAELAVGDTVTVELSGLDTAGIAEDDADDLRSLLNIGLHGAATFEPIVEELITPDRGAYTIDTVDFAFGEAREPGPVAGPFRVSDLEPAEATVDAGDEVTLSATITNDGDTDGDTTVFATLDDDDVAEASITNLDGNDNELAELTITAPDVPGEYTHGIRTDDDQLTGTLVVEEPIDEPEIERTIGSTTRRPDTTTTITVEAAFPDPVTLDTLSEQPTDDSLPLGDEAFRFQSSEPEQLSFDDGPNLVVTFPEDDSDTATVEYDLTTPADAEIGTTIELTGTITAGEDELPVGGDTTIEITDLPEGWSDRGLSDEQFEAVTGPDSELGREEMRDAFEAYFEPPAQEIDGVAVSRDDMRNIFQFYFDTV